MGLAGLVTLAVTCVVGIWLQVPLGEASPGVQRATSSGSPTAFVQPARSRDDREAVVPEHPAGIPPGVERGHVTDHVDGDTLRIMAAGPAHWLRLGEETTVRLLEIDTPESVDPNSPEQCYSAHASNALREMLPLGGQVWVQADEELLDPYGRTLLYLWNEDGEFVNLELVRRGFAKAALFMPNERHIRQMRQAEVQARRAGRGLWGVCEYFGQPRSLMDQSAASSSPEAKPVSPPTAVNDRRFQYCSDANDAGYGNYVLGRDSEYEWYEDADSDGIVCET